MNLKDALRDYSINELGFNVIGFTSADSLKSYVDAWAKTVVIAGIVVWDELFDAVIYRNGRSGLDVYYVYEVILAEKALKLCMHLREIGFKAKHEPYRIPLKVAASKAGVGCYGKNSLIINLAYGSKIRLTSVVTNVEVEPDPPLNEDLCRGCTRCVEACPLNAIHEPYKVDPQRCVNSLLPPPREVSEGVVEASKRLIKRPTRGSAIPCMICQNVCPYNRL
ncbi:MAG: 4Fe-4S double cluster binding domain-containing protein [Candidatus Nezhaarchaeota archaeon]|nr:4Fe-4S double cluster binding domain-containing protein [Candidatus Nezhaarchaeota archaeon]